MIRTNQRPMLKVVLLGMSLLVAIALQGCQHRKPVESHDKIAQKSIEAHDKVAKQSVEIHSKITRGEHHDVGDKLREVFFGEAKTGIWGHNILVVPCRRAERQTLRDNGPLDSHHVIRCGATKVEVVNEELRVNEKSYGKLAAEASVQVADSKVFINGGEMQPVAQVAQK